MRELAKRKETVLSTIEGQGKLTPELRVRIDACWDATELEDIYLPYKPKRKTRAEMARQKGLEPLAALLLIQRENRLDARVHAFVKGEVKDEEEALKGARDIIAEQVSEDERARSLVRGCFARRGVIVSKVVAEVPRLFRFFRTFEALFFAPPACLAERGGGRHPEGEYHARRRRGMHPGAGAPLREGRQCLFGAGGRGGGGRLQAFA